MTSLHSYADLERQVGVGCAAGAQYGLAMRSGPHDMGVALADGRREFEAGGRDWRTPPLWGIGLRATVNGNANLLHDGRARTVTEAILWHGGEADVSRKAFQKMSKPERAALIRFIESL